MRLDLHPGRRVEDVQPEWRGLLVSQREDLQARDCRDEGAVLALEWLDDKERDAAPVELGEQVVVSGGLSRARHPRDDDVLGHGVDWHPCLMYRGRRVDDYPP